MTRRALPLLLALAAAPAVAQELTGTPTGPPTEVTYALGGVVSGLYRVTADLLAGTVSEARPPRGAHGDGARLDAMTMPETARRPLSPAAREEIARLAAAVLRDGPAVRRLCPPTADAIARYRITAPGAVRDATVSTPCFTPEAGALLRALTCAADPAREGCG